MELKAKAQGRIMKPLEEVFDAVYNPKKISGYFVTAGASGPLDEGTTVMWEFGDFPGAFPVVVQKCVKNELLVFGWEAADDEGNNQGYNTTVEIKFTALDAKSTLVEITESGWRDPSKSLKSWAGNGQGWMNMLCCLKAYVEYGINLRENFFTR